MKKRLVIAEYINKETGEVFPANQMIAKQEIVEVENDYRSIKENNSRIQSIGGNYYHMMFNKVLNGDFEENYIVRFMCLCTYLNYENKLVIGDTKGQRKIKEKDLGEILKLKERETIATKQYLLKNKLIEIDKYGVISVNKEYSIKGQIKCNSDVTRVFENGFRKLYEWVSPRQHKLLFIFVKALPYLSKEFNILCENPEESDASLIRPIKFSTLGEKIGLDGKQSRNLKGKLFKLRINDKKVIAEWADDNYKKIVINPAIFWKANSENISDVAKIFDI